MTAVNTSSGASWIALLGNPNCGKTAIFNLLTGMNQKVSNYPGITVERKLGGCVLDNGNVINILDMPGTYSLTPESFDEQIVTEQVLSWQETSNRPSAIVSVIDATNISRNLFLTSQLLDLGIPIILVLNMMDRVKHPETLPEIDQLKQVLGLTEVVHLSAIKKQGVDALRFAIQRALAGGDIPEPESIPYPLDTQVSAILQPLVDAFRESFKYTHRYAVSQSLRFITHASIESVFYSYYSDKMPGFVEKMTALRSQIIQNLKEKGYSNRTLDASMRYQWIDEIIERLQQSQVDSLREKSSSEKMDRVLTHSIAGPIIFIGLLVAVFQSIFTWSSYPMDAIDAGITSFGKMVYSFMPDGVLRSLIVDGIIAGVGAIIIFLPQILILVFAMTLLEDSGYMSRIAFMLDRFMSRIGLHGRSVLPLMSGYACAIPGIMAARTIDSWKERLITILIIPLISCSARLPVYALLIGAFIPATPFWGILNLQGLTMVIMYFLGTITALIIAFILSRFIQTGEKSSFVMELPPYRVPMMRSVIRIAYVRGKQFVLDAGKIIMAMSIVLWVLATFPLETENQSLDESYIGKIGHTIEPVIKPLGFDWKIGVGLITSFAAREVMVSTLATLYNVDGEEEGVVSLKTAMKNDINPETGTRRYTPLVALSLMVFYVFAMQCMATLALVRRETNSWKWPGFMFLYMTLLAYISSFLVYQGGLWLGFV